MARTDELDRRMPRSVKGKSDIAIDVLIVAIVLVGAYGLRAVSSSAFVTWDEPAWVYRSVRFLMAVLRGDFRGTLVVGHPGVMTMWSGAMGLAWHRFVSGTVTATQLSSIDAYSTLQVHDPELMRKLAALLPMAKQGILIAHAAVSITIYWLLRAILDRRHACVGALFLGLDPFYLGLSRVLHLDALSSGLMLIAVLSALLWTRGRRKTPLIWSGVAAGLAALSKATGVLAAPAVAIVLYRGAHGPSPGASDMATLRSRVGRMRQALPLWVLAALLAFVAAWPAMWVAPGEALGSVMGLSLGYAADPGDATATFFRGVATGEPGLLFYPVAVLFRATPLTLVGVLLALLGQIVRAKRGPRSEGSMASVRSGVATSLLLCAALYVVAITASRKKFDRYALAALMSLDIVAALGLMDAAEAIIGKLKGRSQRIRAGNALPALLTALLVALQAVLLVLPLYPAYAIAYYNPWAGGPLTAARTIPVGWGEGIERAAAYLADLPDAPNVTVATWAVAGLAPTFPGRIVTLSEETVPDADYVLLYIGDVQIISGLDRQGAPVATWPLAARFYGVKEPEHIVTVNGVEYVWIYRNDYDEALGARLSSMAAAGDIVMTSAPSVLARSGVGGLPVYQVEGDTEQDVASRLRAATRSARGLFYVDFFSDGRHRTYIQRQLDRYALYVWDEPFMFGTLSYYRLPPDAGFRQVSADTGLFADFEGQLSLEGYGLASARVEYRMSIGLALQWRLLGDLTENLHLFVHLLDDQGRKWGQQDLVLQDDDLLRTSAWT